MHEHTLLQEHAIEDQDNVLDAQVLKEELKAHVIDVGQPAFAQCVLVRKVAKLDVQDTALLRGGRITHKFGDDVGPR